MMQDLKIQIGQLASSMSQPQSASSGNLPLQTIPNSKGGNANVVMLQSGRPVPLLFPTRTPLTRKSVTDEDLLKMFRKVEINIPLLDAIKQVPKYAKFLKELCIHKRKKIKGGAQTRCVVSALAKNEGATVGSQFVRPKKCGDPGIFSIPCTIGRCTFVDAMLNLGSSINVMPASLYKTLNFGDLEPMGMTIQLANRSIVQPLGILEDVNDLIFLADFYVLDMEDETFEKGFALILGCPFLMIVKMKIDVYAGMISMEFGNNLVQFKIFEAMQHPTEDHSLFGINVIDELVDEHTQLNPSSDEMPSLYDEELEYVKRAPVPVAKIEKPMLAQVETDSANQMSNLDRVGQLKSRSTTETFPSHVPPEELKPLPSHLKYAYLYDNQQRQNLIGGGSPTDKATTMKIESDHPRRCEEGGDEATCCWNHLSHSDSN
ncbi:hypothetical protein CR513_17436, partial [Mucuna pruriens]